MIALQNSNIIFLHVTKLAIDDLCRNKNFFPRRPQHFLGIPKDKLLLNCVLQQALLLRIVNPGILLFAPHKERKPE
jgi:hypothetical protein